MKYVETAIYALLFYVVYLNRTPKNSVCLSKKDCDVSISISG